jgi:hypothetical protein
MVGLALIVIGAAIYLRGLGFTSKREVLKIGDVSVSAEEQSPIAPWVAGLAVLAGIALMTTGARRKA